MHVKASEFGRRLAGLANRLGHRSAPGTKPTGRPPLRRFWKAGIAVVFTILAWYGGVTDALGFVGWVRGWLPAGGASSGAVPATGEHPEAARPANTPAGPTAPSTSRPALPVAAHPTTAAPSRTATPTRQPPPTPGNPPQPTFPPTDPPVTSTPAGQPLGPAASTHPPVVLPTRKSTPPAVTSTVPTVVFPKNGGIVRYCTHVVVNVPKLPAPGGGTYWLLDLPHVTDRPYYAHSRIDDTYLAGTRWNFYSVFGRYDEDDHVAHSVLIGLATPAADAALSTWDGQGHAQLPAGVRIVSQITAVRAGPLDGCLEPPPAG
jgi:hypothetical protein